MKKDDLIGQRFGRLVVISIGEPTPGGNTRWECKCDCGNTALVTGTNLKNGMTKSCGCIRKEISSAVHKTHGEKHSKLYGIWSAMKARCKNPNVYAYNRYGGRGISVCDEWQSFQNFMEWSISNGYKEGLSLDRIDNNGNYEPSNCRWATKEQQSENTSQNVFFTYNGETHTMAQWAKIVGSYEARLSWRYKQGWPVEEILFGRKKQ